MAHDERLLSVFVDESGNFGDPDDPARYCIVTLVLHDQSVDISRFVSELDRANYDLGLDPDMLISSTVAFASTRTSSTPRNRYSAS